MSATIALAVLEKTVGYCCGTLALACYTDHAQYVYP